MSRTGIVFCLSLLLLVPGPVLAAEPFPSVAMFEWQRDGAVENGFREGVHRRYPEARFYVYSAAEDPELLQRFLDEAATRDHDLYYVAGTAAARRVLAAEKKKPVVFTMVQAPVEEGLIASWETSENNATGISNRVPILNQLKALRRISSFRTLGVLYNPTNPDSRQQLLELERLQPFLDYEVLRLPVTAAPQVRDLRFSGPLAPEAVYLTHDPLIERLGHSVLERINGANLPSLAADMSLVTRRGALLGLVPDEYRIGRLAALSAVKIFEGSSPTAIPSSALDFFMVALNMHTVREIDVQVPFSLLVIADTIVR